MVGERRTEREHGPILHMLYCILAAMRLWGIDRCFAVCTLKKLDGSINPLMGTGNYNATSRQDGGRAVGVVSPVMFLGE